MVLILFMINVKGEKVCETIIKDLLVHINKRSVNVSQVALNLFKCSEFHVCHSHHVHKTNLAFL